MLTDEQTTALRKRLEGERDRILESADRALGFTMDRDRDRTGRDSMDESTEEWLYATELRLKDRERKLLTKIREAMDRLERSVIDECEDCGDPIGFERLCARPVTTLCIECKESREQGESA
jgi:DnaK suppressor protein